MEGPTNWRNTRTPEEAAADTREPERAARMRIEDDEDTRARQAGAAEGLRAAEVALDDSASDLRDSGEALKARDRELERTGELVRRVAEGAEALLADTARTLDAVRADNARRAQAARAGQDGQDGGTSDGRG
jgi:hypothetical protein